MNTVLKKDKEYSLVLVESPSKAKTISGYLGGNVEVLATYGHVREIPSKNHAVNTETFGVDYVINTKNIKHINKIVDFVKKHKSSLKLYLAMDPDREGEAIAWHMVKILEEKTTMSNVEIKRSVFNAITKSSVRSAIDSPRDLDMNLVNAQQARRALDYLVGFTLSPLLWKTVGGFGASAGRVQSVALRLVAEREIEIAAFKPQEYWTLIADFQIKDLEFQAELKQFQHKKLEKFSFTTEEQMASAREILLYETFSINSVETKKSSRSPSPPFITSTLQQAASQKLGFGAKKTMSVAQKLYEGKDIGSTTAGLITYMRTDGLHIDAGVVKEMRKLIENKFSAKYLPEKARVYSSKKIKNAQEAHEAIRPTNVALTPASIRSYLTDEEYRLYDLIWKRALASQMANAEFETVNVRLCDPQKAHEFATNFTYLTFEGFKALDPESSTEPSISRKEAQAIEENKAAKTLKMESIQHWTESPPRYSEATLIKKMEEIGIGRPSTYATIVSILVERNYVLLNKKRFYCTLRGSVITNFLVGFFGKYVDYDFTAGMEEELDSVTSGEVLWVEMLRKFWQTFSKDADSVAEKAKTEMPTILGTINSGLEDLIFPKNVEGKPNTECPKCGSGLGLKSSKFGYFIGCSKYPDCTFISPLPQDLASAQEQASKTSFDETPSYIFEDENHTVRQANGKFGAYLEIVNKLNEEKRNVSIPEKWKGDLSETQIQKLIELPKNLGEHPDGGDITLNLGRFGFYLKHQTNMASVKSLDPFGLEIDECADILEKQAEKVARNTRAIASPGGEILVRKGGFGKLYIEFDGKKFMGPRGAKFDDITAEDILPLIKKPKPGRKKASNAGKVSDAGDTGSIAKTTRQRKVKVVDNTMIKSVRTKTTAGGNIAIKSTRNQGNPDSAAPPKNPSRTRKKDADNTEDLITPSAPKRRVPKMRVKPE